MQLIISALIVFFKCLITLIDFRQHLRHREIDKALEKLFCAENQRIF